MKTKFIEATQSVEGGPNWGKFAVSQFDEEEVLRPSVIDPTLPLLRACGWLSRGQFLVLDLQTGEGAFFYPGGSAHADLEKHAVWVCPMFEPFLAWLYEAVKGDQPVNLDSLPSLVELPGVPGAMYGYRRGGKG